MPTSTVEDYLKCILLEEEACGGNLVSMGQIAGALRVTPGTVTSMVKTLSDSNLVTYERYTGVRLTEAGRQLALHVLRRHRLIELFLVQIMGMDWSEVHEEAEHLEHAVSDLFVEHMDKMLGHPSFDPHGDPIPSAGGEVLEPNLESLESCAVGSRVEVRRVREQDRSFLRLVEREGLKPGSRLLIVDRDGAADTVLLRRREGGTISLGPRAASRILVVTLGSDGSPEE